MKTFLMGIFSQLFCHEPFSIQFAIDLTLPFGEHRITLHFSWPANAESMRDNDGLMELANSPRYRVSGGGLISISKLVE
jgi:hypothetical protein